MSFFDNTKKEVAGVIMRAEIISLESGVSIFETLEAYANELKKSDKKVSFALKEISKKIRNGQKRWDAYKKYLDEDILKLLKTSEEKSIPAGEIFHKYAPVKEMAEGYIRSIKSGLKSPIVMYILLSGIFSFVVSNFKVINSVSDKKMSAYSMFVMDHYILITGAILAFFVYMFYFIPEKMPILKSIFSKLNALLALSTVVTMFEMGYGAAATTPIVAKQFGLKRKKRNQKNAAAMVEMLRDNKIINAVEGADIKIGIEHGEFKRAMNSILNNKISDVDSLNKEVSKIMDNISVLMTAIPVIIAVSVFVEVMAIVTSSIGG